MVDAWCAVARKDPRWFDQFVYLNPPKVPIVDIL